MKSVECGLHALKYERYYAWKLLLPVIPDRPVLAVGLNDQGLLSLGRSWPLVHAFKCNENEFERAKEQAATVGLYSRFKLVGEDDGPADGYHAIAVGSAGIGQFDAGKIWRLLTPGGSSIWAGHRALLPRSVSMTAKGYAPVKRYALLPPGGCKVFVPISNVTTTLTGLGFYRPGRFLGRLAVTAGRLASTVGCQNYLSTSHLLTAGKPGALPDGSFLFEWLSEKLGVQVVDAALYPGSDSSGKRRLTLQAIDGNGHAVAVIKVADTMTAMGVNEKESEILDLLSREHRLRHLIPRVIGTGNWRGNSVMVQEYLRPDGFRCASSLTHAHVDFLEALSWLDRREVNLHEWPGWQRVLAWSHEKSIKSPEEAEAVIKAVKKCADLLCGVKITLHRIQGDFSPWNMFFMGGRLVVFDWEYSEPSGLPFYDLVHYVLRKRHYLEKKPLSLYELLHATPRSLGVQDQVSTLGSTIQILKEARGTNHRDLTNALFRLSAFYAVAVKTSPCS